MVYWADGKTYVAVVAGDGAIRAHLKRALGGVADEVATFPDDSALLPELDRIAAAERREGTQYRKVLIVQGALDGADHGLTVARWARPFFDKVAVLGSRNRHWKDALGACRADACLHVTGAPDLADRLSAMAATA